MSGTLSAADVMPEGSPDDGGSAVAAPPTAISVFEPTAPVVLRSRLRLGFVLVGLALWLLPWLGDTRGPALTGATAALAFVAAWGYGATALLARTRRGLLVGEALTSALLSGALAALAGFHHAWLPGPDRSATCVPIFVPLAALGLLDAFSRLRRPPLGGEVAAIRVGTALLCAGALFVALDAVPALVALVLAAAPAAVAFLPRAKAARRAVEALVLFAGVALFVAADAWKALARPPESPEQPTVWAFVHPLLAVAIVVLSGHGVVVPEPREASATTQPRPPSTPAA